MTSDTYGVATRPIPVVHERDAPYWTGGGHGELIIQRCGSCHHLIHPPALLCPWDRSPELSWEVTTGQGRVESWTENLQPFLPGFPVPQLIALVKLDDDPTARILTNLVLVDARDVYFEMPVTVVFEELRRDDGPDVYLPLFRPTDGPEDVNR